MLESLKSFCEACSIPWNLALGTLVSEDLAFIYGLFHVQGDRLPSLSFVFFYVLGVLIGDVLLYLVGYMARLFQGNKFVKRLYQALSSKKKKKNFKNDFGLFEEFLAFTRFIPGSRIPTYLYCGLSGYSFFKFTMILLTTSVIYSFLGVLIVSLFKISPPVEINFFLRLSIVLLSAFLTITIFKFILTCRKLWPKYHEVLRPLSLLIKRTSHLEFWPSHILYAPFSPFFIFLFIRYGGFGSILRANPGLKLSGLIGELKSEIDPLIQESNPMHHLQLLPITSKNSPEILNQMTSHGLSFPVIIKPDNGMRGTGVYLTRDQKEMDCALEQSHKSLILQEFCSYEKEWGVFYYRFPHEERGHIFSVTMKELPRVKGDGISNLYQLVLQDPELKYRFDWIFEESKRSPLECPQKDEVVLLGKRGSHSKGCLFKDGSKWIQTSVLDKVKASLDQIEGLHIGRIDLKFESIEKLTEGQFKMIEINGVGGESSNFYDPSLSKLQAYKIIYGQWKLIFQIGQMNKKRGIKTKDSLWTLFKEILKYKNA